MSPTAHVELPKLRQPISTGGYWSLFVGVLGQACFMQPATKPLLPAGIGVMISFLPWLIVHESKRDG
jgi:hypothetical protein